MPERPQHASSPAQLLPAQLHPQCLRAPQSWASGWDSAEKAWQPWALVGQVPSTGASELDLQTLVFVFQPLHTNCPP